MAKAKRRPFFSKTGLLNDLRVVPEALDLIIPAQLFGEDVDDKIEVVGDNPAASRLTGAAEAFYPVLAQRLFDLIGQRLEMWSAVSCCDEIIISHRRKSGNVEQNNLLSFFSQQRFTREANLLKRVYRGISCFG